MGFGRKQTSFRVLDQSAGGATFDDVVALSKEVIESLAPQELALLPMVAQEFRREPAAVLGRPARPEPVADGFDYPTISELVVAMTSILAGLVQSDVIHGAMGNILGDVLKEPMRRALERAVRVRGRRSRHVADRAEGPAPTAPPGAPGRPGPVAVASEVGLELSVTEAFIRSEVEDVRKVLIGIASKGGYPQEIVVQICREVTTVTCRRLEGQ